MNYIILFVLLTFHVSNTLKKFVKLFESPSLIFNDAVDIKLICFRTDLVPIFFIKANLALFMLSSILNVN